MPAGIRVSAKANPDNARCIVALLFSCTFLIFLFLLIGCAVSFVVLSVDVLSLVIV